MLQKTNPIAALPFVSTKPNPEDRDFWATTPSGDDGADFETGRRFARMALAAMNAGAERPPFPVAARAIEAMAAKGRFAALEQGFLGELADLARRDLHDIETPLLKAEGILAAAEMLCNDAHFNRPGREYHALRELVHTAADHVQGIREALFPGDGPTGKLWRLETRPG